MGGTLEAAVEERCGRVVAILQAQPPLREFGGVKWRGEETAIMSLHSARCTWKKQC
jgi:hypothetical protein